MGSKAPSEAALAALAAIQELHESSAALDALVHLLEQHQQAPGHPNVVAVMRVIKDRLNRDLAAAELAARAVA